MYQILSKNGYHLSLFSRVQQGILPSIPAMSALSIPALSEAHMAIVLALDFKGLNPSPKGPFGKINLTGFDKIQLNLMIFIKAFGLLSICALMVYAFVTDEAIIGTFAFVLQDTYRIQLLRHFTSSTGVVDKVTNSKNTINVIGQQFQIAIRRFMKQQIETLVGDHNAVILPVGTPTNKRTKHDTTFPSASPLSAGRKIPKSSLFTL